MQVSLHNKVKTFNLTAGKSLPEWLAERRKNKNKTSESRIELLHDLEFPHSARCIWLCPNGTHLFSAGDYPYRLKCFDVTELSMKYSFNADMKIMSGVCLSSDYKKIALRGEGREITIHHSSAIIDRVRVPHAQRCLSYNRFNAELLSSGASPEIHRLNLETGAFVDSYSTQSAEGVNHVEVFSHGNVSGVILTAGANGCVEAWDSRVGHSVANLKAFESSLAMPGSGGGGICEVRHVSVDENTGMMFACGLDTGEVMLYDIRLHRPVLVKDHRNNLPIVKTYFFKGKSPSTGENNFIVSADTRSVKVWNKADGSHFTSVEAPADITDFCLFRSQHHMVEPFACDDSGVLAVCCDVPRVQVHFIPSLGVAPRWATFLENLTEEMEEKEVTTVYDDYTFIAKEELDRLGMMQPADMADGKIRPALHGAFVENSLYRQWKAVVDPSGLNRYLQQQAAKKKTERWEDRISRFQRKPNTAVPHSSSSSLASSPASGEAFSTDKGATGLEIARQDPRFSKMFHASDGSAFTTTAAFPLDRNNPEYAKLLSTIEERRAKASERRQRYMTSMFSIVPDEGEKDEDHGRSSQEDRKGFDIVPDVDPTAAPSGVREGKGRREMMAKKNAMKSKRKGEDGSSSLVGAKGIAVERGAKVTMYEVKNNKKPIFDGSDKSIHASRKKIRAEKLTLEERLKKGR